MDYLQIFLSRVNDGKPHANYKRSVELHEEYYDFITDNEISEKYLKQLTTRVDDNTFKMVKLITNHIISAVCDGAIKAFQSVPRSKAITRIVEYEGDTDKMKVTSLMKLVEQFEGDIGLWAYLSHQYNHKVFIDPNGFLLIDFMPPEIDINGTVIEKAIPFPVEISCKEVYDYKYINGKLKYLITKTTENEVKKETKILVAGQDIVIASETTSIDTYRMYTPDENFLLVEVKDKNIKIQNNLQTLAMGERNFVKLNGKVFELLLFVPHNIGWVQAFQWGYIYDLRVDKKGAYLSPLHSGFPYLRKMIKAVSEMDITMAYHAFNLKIQAVPVCDNDQCMGGVIVDETGASTTCPSCGGGALKVPQSGVDTLLVKIGRDAQDSYDLDNIVRFISPSVDIIGVQDPYIDKLAQNFYLTVFNAEKFQQNEVAKTATEVKITYENKNNTFYPYAVKLAELWRDSLYTFAEIVDMGQGLKIQTVIGSDFNLKTLNDYFAELERAKAAGASVASIRAIQDKINELIYQDMPDELKKIKIQSQFSPFAGKSETEIMMILANKPADWYYRVLHETESFIYDEIEEDMKESGLSFYDLDYKQQREILDEKIAELAKDFKQPISFDFGGE
jgi:hypothetical protein